MNERKKNQLSFVNYDEIHQRMVNYLSEDIRLYSIGFECLDEYYRILMGNCTDITGYPYSGKTLFLMEILYNLSESHGLKHLLHLPDSGKPEEVIATLLQKRTGKTFDKRYNNLIEEDDIHQHMTWISEHFRILTYEQRPTPFEFWDYACELDDVQTASIDSWNYMKHESEGTKYLADVLSYRNETAERSGKHFFTIIHPKNPTAHDYDNEGRLRPPDVHSLMGGSEWNNNGKNVIVVHKEAKESMEYDIYFRKIKPRIVGKTGFECLNYNITKQRFFRLHADGRQQYAFTDMENDAEKILDSYGGFPDHRDSETNPPF